MKASFSEGYTGFGIWQACCTLRNAPHDVYFDVAMATVLLPVCFCCKSNVACLTVKGEMIHPILSICNAHIALALLINL